MVFEIEKHQNQEGGIKENEKLIIEKTTQSFGFMNGFCKSKNLMQMFDANV